MPLNENSIYVTVKEPNCIHKVVEKTIRLDGSEFSMVLIVGLDDNLKYSPFVINQFIRNLPGIVTWLLLT